MVVLLDLALALMVFVGAMFLGSVALRLFKEETKKDGDDQNKSA